MGQNDGRNNQPQPARVQANPLPVQVQGPPQPARITPQDDPAGAARSAEETKGPQPAAISRKGDELVHSSAVEPEGGEPEGTVDNDPLITVRPRKSSGMCYLAGDYYQFVAGVKTKVPRRFIAHLEDRGVI